MFPSRDTVNRLKEEYPIGSRVELIIMDNEQAPPVGTRGTVRGVDDTGSLLVAWDNGSGLNVLHGVDEVKKLDSVTTICYGEEKHWDLRSDAISEFHNAMLCTEGSEQDRYGIIYTKLIAGLKVCSDDPEGLKEIEALIEED